MKQERTKPRRRPARGPGEALRAFLAAVEKDEAGHGILAEQNHRVELDLVDGRPLLVEIRRGRVRVRSERLQPRRFDRPDVTHFQLETRTLLRLLRGQMLFTDALLPVDPSGRDSLRLLECTLLKWSVLNWLGRLFRAGQTVGQPRVSRTPAERTHA